MRHLSKQFHREIVKPYGEELGTRLFGTADDVHPLVEKMLLYTSPNYIRGDNYEAFIDELVKAVPRMEKYSATREEVSAVISAKDLHEYMKLLATGMQYVHKKTGDCHASDFYFSSILEEYDGTKSSNFNAAFNMDTNQIAINPYSVVLWKVQRQQQSVRESTPDLPGQFNGDEKVILRGAEEMYHSHQKNRIYKFMPKLMELGENMTYQNNPLEKDAKNFLDLAVRELQIGSHFRHMQHHETQQAIPLPR